MHEFMVKAHGFIVVQDRFQSASMEGAGLLHALYGYTVQAMRCQLIRHRDQGALIPRHRQAFIHRPEGDLQVREEYAKTLGRHLLVARLVDDSGRALEGVPPLFDVQVVQITIDTMLLSGFERLRDQTGVKLQDFAQTWEAKVLEAVKTEWVPGEVMVPL